MTSNESEDPSVIQQDGQYDEEDEYRCSVCGVPECTGDPAECETNLRAAAHALGRSYAATVSSAEAAARAGDTQFAAEEFEIAEELFTEMEGSPYRELCLDSMHRYNWFLVRHATAAAQAQEAIRAVAGRPPFDPFEFFVPDDTAASVDEVDAADAADSGARLVDETYPPDDMVGFGRSLWKSAWASGQDAVRVLTECRGGGEDHEEALRLLDTSHKGLVDLTSHGHMLAALDLGQRSDVLRGMFSAAHAQTQFGVHEAWHRLHPEASNGCDLDDCYYRTTSDRLQSLQRLHPDQG